jgi:hypothetical protein
MARGRKHSDRVIRSADEDEITRYRLARPLSVPYKAALDDTHAERMGQRLYGAGGRRALSRTVLLNHRFARGRSAHRTPNPYLWARERTQGGPRRYFIKARKLPLKKITGSWFAKAGYPLRPFGKGAKGSNRSVHLVGWAPGSRPRRPRKRRTAR